MPIQQTTQPDPTEATVAKSDAETPDQAAAQTPAATTAADSAETPQAPVPPAAPEAPAAKPADEKPADDKSASAVPAASPEPGTPVTATTATPAEAPASAATTAPAAAPAPAKETNGKQEVPPAPPAPSAAPEPAAAMPMPAIAPAPVAAPAAAPAPSPVVHAHPAPPATAAPIPVSIPAAPVVTQAPKPGDPSFLYVEDDPFSREVITRLVKQNMGYPNLTVFEDSSDFMSRVKNLPAIPDVILLDIQISPLNGHQMLKLLRDDDMFKKSRIIALTASVMASEVKQLQDAGFDGLIGKPVMKRVFPELLQRILDGEPVWYVS